MKRHPARRLRTRNSGQSSSFWDRLCRCGLPVDHCGWGKCLAQCFEREAVPAGAPRAARFIRRRNPPASARSSSATSGRCSPGPSAKKKAATVEERIVEAITWLTGSTRFVSPHLACVGFCVVADLGWVPGVPASGSSLVLLAMVASVEASLLSTFVLVSQNRMPQRRTSGPTSTRRSACWRNTRSPGWSRRCRRSLPASRRDRGRPGTRGDHPGRLPRSRAR